MAAKRLVWVPLRGQDGWMTDVGSVSYRIRRPSLNNLSQWYLVEVLPPAKFEGATRAWIKIGRAALEKHAKVMVREFIRNPFPVAQS